MEGLLEKRGAWNRAWKTRLFVLTNDGLLRYFRPGGGGGGGAPLGTIQLRAAPGAPRAGGGTATVVRAGGVECGRDLIEVQTPGRTYVLGASSRRTRSRPAI